MALLSFESNKVIGDRKLAILFLINFDNLFFKLLLSISSNKIKLLKNILGLVIVDPLINLAIILFFQ